ncbi:MAG: HD domain-containing protein [Prolixibacteraceae bacterium]|jgi:putative nucleotidyltransferase with HDIG domain|nr:HD domain-containing protein [Prolixibacteraceae bacterium]
MENNTTTSGINTISYNAICNTVMDYMLSFQSDNSNIQQNFNLKREHIHRVIGYSEVLTRSLECENEVVLTAQLAALLHDIGRFEQFQKYETYNDSISEDHAELGVNIILKNKWLAIVSEEIRSTILKAVSLHNKLTLPKTEKDNELFIAKIIRDADKIDILDLTINEYSNQNKTKNKSFSLDLDISSAVSKQIAKSLNAEKLPSKKDMKTVTDFKLVQLSFVYDLNFKKSYEIINKKSVLKQLFETLPKTDQVFDLYRKAKIHLENQLI